MLHTLQDSSKVMQGSDVVNAAQDDFTPDLWHWWLAYMSEKGLQILAKKSLIPFAKDQVFHLFKKFHAIVEREKWKSLKCLRTHNGGEYTSTEFENYCSENGIRHEKKVPSIPQHNGVVERINRIIFKKVRCMLKMTKQPKSFWAEAVQTACYLINRSPSVLLDFDIPKRMWKGEDASYAHLKVFGCKTFAHVPEEQRLKLDNKAIPYIFV